MARYLRRGNEPVATLNVPNIITIVRILLAPVMFVMLIVDNHHDGALRVSAALIFIVAIAGDALDGHLARSRNLITDLGKLLDPIADKVLTGAAFIALSVLGELPWWVTIIVIVREWGITIWRFFQLKNRVIAASWAGKWKTIFQAVALSLALLPLWNLLGGWMHWVNGIVMTIAVILTITSGIDYLWKAYRAPRPAAESAGPASNGSAR